MKGHKMRIANIVFHRTFLFFFLLSAISVDYVLTQDDLNQIVLSESESGIITVPLLHRNHVRSRRRRELRQNGSRNMNIRDGKLKRLMSTTVDSNPSGRLYQGYGTHYVDLWVGNPQPQRQTLIVDTGSSATAFPCQNCYDCGDKYHTDPAFNDKESVTFAKQTCMNCTMGRCVQTGPRERWCGIDMLYAEGSNWYAFEATDLVYFGGPHHVALLGGRLNTPNSKEGSQNLDGYKSDGNETYKIGNEGPKSEYYLEGDMVDSEIVASIDEYEKSTNSIHRPTPSTEELGVMFAEEVKHAEGQQDTTISANAYTFRMSFGMVL